MSQYFWPEPGAPSVRYDAIVRTLVGLGIDVDVVTGAPSYPTGRVRPGYSALRPMVEEHLGARVHRLPLFPYGGRSRALRLLNHASLAASSLTVVARPFGADLVVVESPPLPLALSAAAIARREGAPLVVYVADLWPDSALAMGALRDGWVADRLRDLETAVYRAAWRITAPTEGVYASVAAHPAGGAERTLLLPNGVDPAVFHPYDPAGCEEERALLADIADGILFVSAGTLNRTQGLDVLLHAAALLRDERRVSFAIVGEGPERPRLEALARDLRLERVRFVGALPAERVARVLAFARATVVTRLDIELFRGARPARVLPSLACATPVVFAGRGEMAELLERVGCGVVVPPEDPAALARAISRLAQAPDAARAMGERGRAWALAEYDFPALVRRWIDALAAARRSETRG